MGAVCHPNAQRKFCRQTSNDKKCQLWLYTLLKKCSVAKFVVRRRAFRWALNGNSDPFSVLLNAFDHLLVAAVAEARFALI